MAEREWGNGNRFDGVQQKVVAGDIDERWGSSREEDADVAKKPLIGYEEWRERERAVEAGYAREARNRSHLEDQMGGETWRDGSTGRRSQPWANGDG